MLAACPIPAAQYWRLRSHFEVERAIAAGDGRDLQLVGYKSEGPMLKRQVVCRLLKNPVPAALRGVVPLESTASEIESTWNPDSYKEQDSCAFTIRVPAFGSRLSISGRQWCEEAGELSCTVCTTFSISCTVAAVARAAERVIARELERSYSEYPQKTARFREILAGEPPPIGAELGGAVEIADIAAFAPRRPWSRLWFGERSPRRVRTTEEAEGGCCCI